MPQMAPISWLVLFLIFSGSLLMFNFLNYFSFLPSISTPETQGKIEQKPLNWPW